MRRIEGIYKGFFTNNQEVIKMAKIIVETTAEEQEKVLNVLVDLKGEVVPNLIV